MPPGQIRKIVEDYPNYLTKKEKLQKRLIQLSGRDPEQEIAILQRLESLERAIDIVDSAIYGDVILTIRESCVVERRMEGLVYREIGEIYLLTRERVRQILELSYKKMADTAKKQNIA
jgi:DNA-directed RNA polymerase sigma subunit (sigma70/sigma32)